MREISLDFARSRRKAARLDLALLAAGVLGLVAGGVRYVDLRSGIELREGQQALAAARSVRPVSPAATPAEAEHLRLALKEANAVIERLDFPWSSLFHDIEAEQSPDVALLAVLPDPEKRTIKISGEAKDLDAMLGYLRLLQSRNSLTGVFLESHRIDEKNAERPIVFVVQATWALRP